MRPGILACFVAISMIVAAHRASAQVGSVSPGKLATPHAAFEDQCNRCHVPFQGIPDQNCLACHSRLADRLLRGIGYHATVSAQRCSSCHKDHQGRTAQLSPAPGSAFDHRTAVFQLAGAHAALPCARCHATTATGRQWVGTPATCAGCHPDRSHKGSFGSGCASCHQESAWKPTLRTLTNHKTTITGGHAGLTCANCHKLGLHLAQTQSCANCHTQKHGGTKVECVTCHSVLGWKKVDFVHDFCTCKLPGKHQTAPCLSCHPQFRFKPTPFECAACHDKERPHEALGACSRCHSALSWKTKAFDHNATSTRFALAGKHFQVGCENCHTKKGKFRMPLHACETCHAVPAHGDFGGCATCHTVAGFAPSTFDHGTTKMPLDGAHATVACQTCHAKFKRGTYVAGPDSCRLCHGDPHGGQFGAPGGAGPANPRPLAPDPGLLQLPPPSPPPPFASGHRVSAGRACLDCHRTNSWVPSTITVATHGDLGYPLNGAHTKATCAGCHRAGAFAGTTRACNGCHTDFRHRGRFGTSCEDCHTEAAWRPVARFDHARTGFVLRDGHANVGCDRCHGGNGQRLVGAKTPTACQTCHAAIHGAQFGEACTTCHSTVSFRQTPPFDHTRKTTFPLELRHRALSCETCHDARRRPLIERSCRGCHGDPHRGSNSIECADCHRADRWRLIRFDHDLTDYPLTGRHRVAVCTECHTNPNWTGIRTDCLACHALDRPRTQDHLMLTTCDDCHTTRSWRGTRR